MVVEVVRFRSARGAGVDQTVLDHERPLTRRLLWDSDTRIIVSVGAWVLWELRSIFPALQLKVPPAQRLCDLVGQIIDIPWPEADRSARILVSPHLTGSSGFSRSTLALAGERLSEALNLR